MFTGLIEATGTIKKIEMRGGAGSIEIASDRSFDDIVYGESIAVNGACLTVERFADGNMLRFHTLAETLARTNLSTLGVGATVNLERALKVGDRLGGHIVSGHVDAVCKILAIKAVAGDIEIKVAMKEELAGFLVEKGSIAIDGISLTLIEVTEGFFTVGIIPVTLSATALNSRKVGDEVNIETDLFGKYIHRQLELAAREKKSTITMETLEKAGFFE